MLDSLITSKTRIKLLLKFFLNSSTKGYLRGLATEFNESTNSIRVELNRLTEAGLLTTEQDKNTVTYKANKLHPLFQEITSIVKKYIGIDQIIENVLKKLGDLEQAYLIGDYANGIDSGTIELILIGKVDEDYLNQLIEKGTKLIGRSIIVKTYTLTEFEVFQSKTPEVKKLIIFGA